MNNGWDQRQKELEKPIFEPPISWAADRSGRKSQIDREVAALATRARRFVSEVDEKIREVTAVEDEDKVQIRDASHLAYDSLREVVDRLLKIENGGRQLSRQDPAICATLDEAVRQFRILSDISRENAQQLGSHAADYMALGDQAATFFDDLQSYVDSVNIDVPYIWSAMEAHKVVFQEKQGREGELRGQVESAQGSRDDIGNNFLGFFNPSVLTILDSTLQDAKDRLERNHNDQRQAREQMTEYYKFAIWCRNAGSVVLELKGMVQHASEAFDVEYSKLTTAQLVENGLWDGLMSLRNHIDQTDYRTTRDSSLRVILKLLQMDDKIFLRQQVYEDTEDAIKVAIKKKLGEDALARLQQIAPIESNGINDY
ncbi:hypothetical protein T440DRAFT_287039 [Plenodomus tracheiphilus IPT5]|uniref:Uncharacterized protein n=1 Tax=Plenodomus tracheiphilus IPT5 TaxID=1408161 RepID=A0A6A7BDX9_9PLEO|nr:hypothetical protein T440DRAFT_287039 [Plenodomus tracheiphilus IPT5]